MIRSYIKKIIREVLEEHFLKDPNKSIKLAKVVFQEAKNKEHLIIRRMLEHEYEVDIQIEFITTVTSIAKRIKFINAQDMLEFCKKASVDDITKISKVENLDDIIGFKKFDISVWYNYAVSEQLEVYRFLGVGNTDVMNIKEITKLTEQVVKMLSKYPEVLL